MINNILFPIESISREIDYKLILATMCSDEDVVYIAQHDYLYYISKFMSGGTYLGKNLFAINTDGTWKSRHTKLKKRGFSIVYLDEEGAVYWGDEETWKRRLNKRINVDEIKKDDHICTWGSFQKQHYQNVTKALPNNIVVTGHPRFDLFRGKYSTIYQEDVNKIKAKYGDFILIPTAFAWFNNSQGYKDSFSKRWSFSYDNSIEAKKEQIGNWSYSGKTFCSYVEMILYLSTEFPEINIILRPHPAEDASVYKNALSDIKNIHIISNSGITSWILSCKLLIQDGCTTAIEGYMGNKPTISFQPIDELKYDMFLPSVVSTKTRTINDVVEVVKQVFNKENSYINTIKDEKAVSLFVNFKSKRNTDAFESVFSVLEKSKKSKKNIKDDQFNNYLFLLFRIRYKFLTILKNLIRPLFAERNIRHNALKKIFPGFNKKEILETIKKIEQITNKKISCKFVNENLIILTKVK